MEWINSIVIAGNDFLWSYILIAALIFTGILFTISIRFVQFRSIPEMFRVLGDGISSTKRGVSSFNAFCISVASRVGTGNLAGVATALAIGGAGAIFWMWLMALIGAASSFAESSLAQLYKQNSDDGGYVGGPAYYIQKGLKMRWMGVLFAVIISMTFGLFFNSVQSNTIALAFSSNNWASPVTMGVVLTIITLLIIFGGIKRISRVSSIIVPFMAVGYICVALYICISNIQHLWDVIKLIVNSAFGLEPFVGGGVGVAVMQGVRRGLFSNEAGMGSAPNAAATAEVSHPVKQGLIQALGVFTDTLLVCSATAFIILMSDIPLDGSIKGIELTQAAMDTLTGSGFGTPFIAVCIFMFAFSSIIGNYYYGETNIRFITPKKYWLNIYRITVAAMIFIGTIASLDFVWNVADLFMGIMALINLFAIIMLRKKVVELFNNYRNQRKSGIKSPIYKDNNHECWR